MALTKTYSSDDKPCPCGSGKLLKNCEPCFSLISKLRKYPKTEVLNIIDNIGLDSSKIKEDDLKFGDDGSLHITFEYGKDPVVYTSKRKH